MDDEDGRLLCYLVEVFISASMWNMWKRVYWFSKFREAPMENYINSYSSWWILFQCETCGNDVAALWHCEKQIEKDMN